MSEPKTFEVGGCTRDKRMGIPTKDVDFAVEIGSFSEMRDWLANTGFEIFEEREEFLTIRAKVPNGHSLLERTKVADFVMCRKDSATSDGRRPDFVEPGNIFDDLARRDFTMNAIAEDTSTGEVLDPWGGIADIRAKKLRFVGDPTKRITEDGLRVLRGFRFMVTKDVMPDGDTGKHMVRPLAVEMLAKVSTERIQQELHKMFAHDTLRTLEVLSHHMPPEMLDIIFGDDKIKLSPTMKARI